MTGAFPSSKRARAGLECRSAVKSFNLVIGGMLDAVDDQNLDRTFSRLEF